MRSSLSERTRGPLTIRVEEGWDSLWLRAAGEIDLANADLLEEELRGAFSSDASVILLDLDEVAYMDSTGLRVLLWGVGYSREHGDPLCVRAGSRAIRQMIDVTGIEPHLPLTD